MSEQLDCERACILTLCPLTALPTSVLVALCKKPSMSEWAFWLALEAKLAGEGFPGTSPRRTGSVQGAPVAARLLLPIFPGGCPQALLT